MAKNIDKTQDVAPYSEMRCVVFEIEVSYNLILRGEVTECIR